MPTDEELKTAIRIIKRWRTASLCIGNETIGNELYEIHETLRRLYCLEHQDC